MEAWTARSIPGRARHWGRQRTVLGPKSHIKGVENVFRIKTISAFLFRFPAVLPLVLLGTCCSGLSAQAAPNQPPASWAIAIHGGAGEAEWLNMDAATAEAYRAALERALASGAAVLKDHGTAIDAVQAAVEVLEDTSLFNAGRGSAFAANGTNEMDASIMNGADLAGAGTAGVHFTRHPIRLARAVMERTPYVLMVGAGADAFSKDQHLEQEPPSYFFTEMRWKEFEDVMRKSTTGPCLHAPPGSRQHRLARRRETPFWIRLRSSRTVSARWVLWRETARVTSPLRHPPGACRESCRGGLATLPSWAPEPMLTIVVVRFPEPASASTSSAFRLLTRSISTAGRATLRKRPPISSSTRTSPHCQVARAVSSSSPPPEYPSGVTTLWECSMRVRSKAVHPRSG